MPEPPSQRRVGRRGRRGRSPDAGGRVSPLGRDCPFRRRPAPTPSKYCRQHGAAIGLVLMEVALPEMDGPTTARCLAGLCPNLRCWFMGGTGGGYYPGANCSTCGAEGLLPKPFDLQMLRTLRRANHRRHALSWQNEARQ